MKNSDVARSAVTRPDPTAIAFRTAPPALAPRTLNAPPAIGTIQMRFGIRSVQLPRTEDICLFLHSFSKTYGTGIGKDFSTLEVEEANPARVWNSGVSMNPGKTPSATVRIARKIIGPSMYADPSRTLANALGSFPKKTRAIVQRA